MKTMGCKQSKTARGSTDVLSEKASVPPIGERGISKQRGSYQENRGNGACNRRVWSCGYHLILVHADSGWAEMIAVLGDAIIYHKSEDKKQIYGAADDEAVYHHPSDESTRRDADEVLAVPALVPEGEYASPQDLVRDDSKEAEVKNTERITRKTRRHKSV